MGGITCYPLILESTGHSISTCFNLLQAYSFKAFIRAPSDDNAGYIEESPSAPKKKRVAAQEEEEEQQKLRPIPKAPKVLKAPKSPSENVEVSCKADDDVDEETPEVEMVVRCHLCEVDFRSQVSYDKHLPGKKHKHRLKLEAERPKIQVRSWIWMAMGSCQLMKKTLNLNASM